MIKNGIRTTNFMKIKVKSKVKNKINIEKEKNNWLDVKYQ